MICDDKSVRINVAFRVLPIHSKKKLKKNGGAHTKHWPRGPAENKLWWPQLARHPQKGMRASGHIANVKAWIGCVVYNWSDQFVACDLP